MSGFGFCSGISFRGRVPVGDLKVEVVPLTFRGFGSLTTSLHKSNDDLKEREEEKLPAMNESYFYFHEKNIYYNLSLKKIFFQVLKSRTVAIKLTNLNGLILDLVKTRF